MTPEEFKKEIEGQCAAYYCNDEIHCDTWQICKFISSLNQKFVACLINRIYENYCCAFDQSYNELHVYNLETGDSWRSGMLKFEESGGNVYFEKNKIDLIISVSDDGKVVYRTQDKKEHVISLSN